MTYEEMVRQAREVYSDVDASGIQEHIAFQFNVTGEGEGAFYMEIADGKVSVEPYEYYDRDVLIITPQDVLLKIATGEQDPVAAFLTGKISVEGDFDKALKLKDLSAAAAKKLKKTAKKPGRPRKKAQETK